MLMLSFAGTLAACGVPDMPREVPDSIHRNWRELAFTADIVDEAGVPLRGVKTQVILHSLAIDPFIGQHSSYTYQWPARQADESITCNACGSNAILVQFSKNGYAPLTCAFSQEDNPRFGPDLFTGTVAVDQRIDLRKVRRPRVILHPIAN